LEVGPLEVTGITRDSDVGICGFIRGREAGGRNHNMIPSTQYEGGKKASPDASAMLWDLPEV
jgi:hypothetical protein